MSVPTCLPETPQVKLLHHRDWRFQIYGIEVAHGNSLGKVGRALHPSSGLHVCTAGDKD